MAKLFKVRHVEIDAGSIIKARRLTFSQAAQQLGVHVSTVWRWTSTRNLPFIQLGGRRYLLVEDLENFLRCGRLPPTTTTTEQASTDARSHAAAKQLQKRGV